MTEDQTFEALKKPLTADQKEFGRNAIVYCRQHLCAHATGWCTVPNSQKIKLESKTIIEGTLECREKGFAIFYK